MATTVDVEAEIEIPAAGEESLSDEPVTLALKLRPVLEISDHQLFELCALNDELRIERTAEGALIIMSPAGWETGRRNLEVAAQLAAWARQDGSGIPTDSSAGFILPNRAMRGPDAAWVEKSRLARVTQRERERHLPLCPDFVIEVRSPTDRLRDQRHKMREYLDNGARLGLLVDPVQQQVYVYRPGQPVQRLPKPDAVACDPELPGFVLDLREIP